MAKMAEERLNARNFAAIVQELRAGQCVRDLTQALNEVTEACVQTGKSGFVQLKLTVVPQGSSQAVVRDNITKSIPNFTIQPTVMFIDGNYNLNRRDVRQMDLSEVVSIAAMDKPVSVEEEEVEPTRLDD